MTELLLSQNSSVPHGVEEGQGGRWPVHLLPSWDPASPKELPFWEEGPPSSPGARSSQSLLPMAPRPFSEASGAPLGEAPMPRKGLCSSLKRQTWSLLLEMASVVGDTEPRPTVTGEVPGGAGPQVLPE